MDKHTKEALLRVIDYIYDAEHKDFEENGKPQNHIFTDIKMVADWELNNRV